MLATRFKIGLTVVGIGALCRCSLAYDLEELDNGSGDSRDASAGQAGSGGHDASADATNDGVAGAGGSTPGDAAGGTGGAPVLDAASDGSDGAVSDAGSDAGNLTLGLVAHYRFDEWRGSSAADATGNNQPGTLVNGASFASGVRDNSVSLDGGGEYVSLPANIVRSYGAFSISVWFRLNTTTASWARIFDFGSGTTRYLFLAPRTPTNQVRFGISTGGGGAEQQLNSSGLSAGNWHHVAVTLSGSTGTLYVNGAQVAQNTSMSLAPADLGDTNRNWLGRSQFSADPYLNGRIDNLRMYSRVLTLQEVQTLEAGGL
ncbi:MAG TPA: LamG domain-containing protein [Polyangiaceae bacterium]